MVVYKLLAETEEEKFRICDGKNDELYELCKGFRNCQMLSQIHRIKETVRVENHGATIRDSKRKRCKWIFLVIDGFTGIKNWY